MEHQGIRSKEQGASILALGNFNPAIFHPVWFSTNNLIRQQEAEESNVKIIHPDVTVIDVNWFLLEVIKDRFTINTRDASKFYPLRDLVSGVFTILEHTPVHSLSFVRFFHVAMESEEEWNACGNFWAPKDAWHKVIQNPGMRVLAIEGKRIESKANSIRVKIEPSQKIKYGVYLEILESYNAPDKENRNESLLFFLNMLKESWPGFLTYCDETLQYLLHIYKG